MAKAVKLKRSSRSSNLLRESSGDYCAKPSGNHSKPYDLEERTLVFALDVRALLKRLPKTIANVEDGKQVVRSSGSVGSNYIEANEALGKKDFLMRIKISRKEAKESRFFLRLLDTGGILDAGVERGRLVAESTELMNIFGSIYRKSG
jgi:four helix bundle protein